MSRFLVDEDQPRADDVRDVGLRGRSDAEVLAWANERGAAVVSGDMGFANLLQFPLGSHAKIVVSRFPTDMTNAAVNRLIVQALREISEDDLLGNLVIIEPARVRLRRAR